MVLYQILLAIYLIGTSLLIITYFRAQATQDSSILRVSIYYLWNMNLMFIIPLLKDNSSYIVDVIGIIAIIFALSINIYATLLLLNVKNMRTRSDKKFHAEMAILSTGIKLKDFYRMSEEDKKKYIQTAVFDTPIFEGTVYNGKPVLDTYDMEDFDCLMKKGRFLC